MRVGLVGGKRLLPFLFFLHWFISRLVARGFVRWCSTFIRKVSSVSLWHITEGVSSAAFYFYIIKYYARQHHQYLNNTHRNENRSSLFYKIISIIFWCMAIIHKYICATPLYLSVNGKVVTFLPSIFFYDFVSLNVGERNII